MIRTIRNGILAVAGLAAVVLLLLNWKIAEDIQLEGAAYLYKDLSRGAPVQDAGRTIHTKLTGSYNPGKEQFRGRWTVGNTEYRHVLFTRGFGIIAYEGKERIAIGRIDFDPDSGRYAIDITNPALIRTLAPDSQQIKRLRLAAPAEDRKEAEKVYKALAADSP